MKPGTYTEPPYWGGGGGGGEDFHILPPHYTCSHLAFCQKNQLIPFSAILKLKVFSLLFFFTNMVSNSQLSLISFAAAWIWYRSQINWGFFWKINGGGGGGGQGQIDGIYMVILGGMSKQEFQPPTHIHPQVKVLLLSLINALQGIWSIWFWV